MQYLSFFIFAVLLLCWETYAKEKVQPKAAISKENEKCKVVYEVEEIIYMYIKCATCKYQNSTQIGNADERRENCKTNELVNN